MELRQLIYLYGSDFLFLLLLLLSVLHNLQQFQLMLMSSLFKRYHDSPGQSRIYIFQWPSTEQFCMTTMWTRTIPPHDSVDQHCQDWAIPVRMAIIYLLRCSVPPFADWNRTRKETHVMHRNVCGSVSLGRNSIYLQL